MAKGTGKNNERSDRNEKEKPDYKQLERTASSVADIFGADQTVDRVVHAEELDGMELILTGFKRLTGATGDYLFIYCFEPGKEELLGFSCGGGVILEKLDKVQELQKFPLRVLWTMKTPKSGGRAYYDIVQVD